MKSDLDALLQAHNLDALLVTGAADHNPAMVYFTGIAHLTSADLIQKRGAEAVLFYRTMERDEAAKTGLAIKNIDDYRIDRLLEDAGGDLLKAVVARYRQMLTDLGITSGRLGIYGQMDAGSAHAVFSALQEAMPGLRLVSDVEEPVLAKAMATKDEAEVERIRQMGRVTVEVVDLVADFLTTRPVHDQVLVKPDGSPLTVGDVKNRINLWLAERGAENPEGTIFAIGQDAGVPHSAGTASDPLRLGQTIVFDIFPCEAGGGYFYDFTRTWCLGYAPDEAQALYEDVLAVYKECVDWLQPGISCREFQLFACDLFEKRGHPTAKNDPSSQEGYVHGLGHSLGLHIHEDPMFILHAPDSCRLEPGTVVTVEPGLYYPQRGLGMRLENTIWVRPDGQKEVLADYPMDLVLPMKR